MFKHILIPTDGSRTAAKAIEAGVRLAKEMGAKVTGYYAQEPLPTHLYGEGYVADASMTREFERRAGEFAQRCVEEIGAAARTAGVPFEPLVEKAAEPHQGIMGHAQGQLPLAHDCPVHPGFLQVFRFPLAVRADHDVHPVVQLPGQLHDTAGLEPVRRGDDQQARRIQMCVCQHGRPGRVTVQRGDAPGPAKSRCAMVQVVRYPKPWRHRCGPRGRSILAISARGPG